MSLVSEGAEQPHMPAAGVSSKKHPWSDRPPILITTAFNAIHAYRDEFETAYCQLDQTESHRAMLSALHMALAYLVANPDEQERFREAYAVKDHPNAKNPIQADVKVFFRNCHTVLRIRVCKVAGAIKFAIDEKLASEEFVARLDQDGEVAGLYRKYVRADNTKDKRQDRGTKDRRDCEKFLKNGSRIKLPIGGLAHRADGEYLGVVTIKNHRAYFRQFVFEDDAQRVKALILREARS